MHRFQVTVALFGGSERATLRCNNKEGFDVAIIGGVASFTGLYINEAGTEYALQFSTDLLLDGLTQVVSRVFSVGIGPAATIVLVRDASNGVVFGGKAFTPQPRAEVHDKGGNIVETDSSSAIQISFYSNPSGGMLSPMQGTMGYLDRGIVQFRGLSIDKAGEHYRLAYTFLDHINGELVPTSIITLGMPFNVEIGPAYKLSILRHASGGWAGNQPFSRQPKIALVDKGGNVVVGDSTNVVTATVVPSLSYSTHIIVDTTDDPTPVIDRVAFSSRILSDGRILYGPGDSIEIIVTFTQEVALYPKGDGSSLPRLILNAIHNGSAGVVYAELANIPPEGELTKTLLFEYYVNIGDSQTELDYQSEYAFQSGDYSVEDAFGRAVSLNLPALGSGFSMTGSKVVGVSDSRPSITDITADLSSGEYEIGAGHVLDFILSFDREVRAFGVVWLISTIA
jgi:hypothetical protein